jgi:formate hydrogenlyase subunit 6/NADH:ubiquinone oxidoreductase subunit I
MLKRDEQGRENCTACGLCALSCPAEAINGGRTQTDENIYMREKYASIYEINMLRCIFVVCARLVKRCDLLLLQKYWFLLVMKEDFILER